MSGKGDRWGRDSVGRSAPAFMVASTTASRPPPTCKARQHHLQLLFLLQGRPTVGRSFVLRPEPDEESAGCVRLQWFCSAGCVPAVPTLPAMPTALISSCPRSVCLPQFRSLCFAPVHCHVRQDRCLQVCKLQNCPVGSCNMGLQWRPMRRVHFDFFFLQSP